MRINIQVEDKHYEVEINQSTFDGTFDDVRVNGKPVDVTVCQNWNRMYSKNLIIGNKSYQIEFEYDKGDIPKRVRAVGQAVDIVVDFPGTGKLKRPDMVGLWGDGDQVRAPLPGKVMAVNVKKGQEVEAGEVLCLLEAMKMENEIISHRAGVVKEVLIEKGDSVELEQVLINLE